MNVLRIEEIFLQSVFCRPFKIWTDQHRDSCGPLERKKFPDFFLYPHYIKHKELKIREKLVNACLEWMPTNGFKIRTKHMEWKTHF